MVTSPETDEPAVMSAARMIASPPRESLIVAAAPEVRSVASAAGCSPGCAANGAAPAAPATGASNARRASRLELRIARPRRLVDGRGGERVAGAVVERRPGDPVDDAGAAGRDV